MDLATPEYLLFSEVDLAQGVGHWRFVLRSPDGAQQFEAADAEPGLQGERLDLLTVVRALEALDQPSCVTMVDCSQYVWQGVHYGLPEWRDNGWRWEFFGQMVPVKNHDLWQRMDRAMHFHRVECRRRRFDPPHRAVSGPTRTAGKRKDDWGIREKAADWLKYVVSQLPGKWHQSATTLLRTCRRWAIRSCRPRTAFPWTA